MANKLGGIQAVANPFEHDVFADEAVAFNHINGTIRINFAVVKAQEAAPPSANQFVGVGRLVMPLGGAQRLCLGLYNYLKKVGHDPFELISNRETPEKVKH
jgi:hypothetical protein